MIAHVLIAAAPVAAGVIVPPLGVVLHQTSEQVRSDGRTVHRFRIARDIVFAADGDGYAATVTLKSADADADAAERRDYADANAPLLGRPITIRLDARGAVRSVDDLDAISADWAGGLAALIPAGRNAGIDALRERLRTLPAARRQAMIGSMASTLFAAPDDRAAAPARPVTLASPPPFTDVALTGTMTLSAEGSAVRVRSTAQGRTAATATLPAASVAVTADRLVETASGLILEATGRESLTGRGLRSIVTTRTTLTR